MTLRFLLGTITLLCAAPLYADSTAMDTAPTVDRYAHFCSPTPALSSYGYPGGNYVHPSNKLARPAGKSEFANGQLLYITGRVFDSACVPLSNATVELWHRDADGDYRISDGDDLASHDALFAGAGTAKTDNRGEFIFETIMPAGGSGNQPPLVNLRINHPAMSAALQTTFFFEGDSRNNNHKAYSLLSSASQALITAAVQPAKEHDNAVHAHMDITVQGRDGFRGF